MKKLYIKINDSQTEEMAIKKAEELGYEESDLYSYKGREIMKLKRSGYYRYTDYIEEDLINNGYEELKLEEFELGEQVGVSNRNKEQTLKDLTADYYKYYYTGGINSKGEYIVEDENGNLSRWRYIAKIPKEEKKKITLELTDEQLKKIKDLIK